MLCSNCNKAEANFHYKQVNNGHYKELHLCSECAAKLGYLSPQENIQGVSLNDMLSEFLGLVKNNSPKEHSDVVNTCPNCGIRADEFKKNGYVGCHECYNTFESEIEAILNRIQPSTTHRGKINGEIGEKIQKTNLIKELKDKLKAAVIDERYEEAASLRDKIREMELKEKEGDK